MTETVTQAVAQRSEMSQFIQTYQKVFAEVVPSHVEADAFVRIAQGLLRRNPDLAAAAMSNPESLLAALMDCARLGHEPGTDRYALTFRKIQGKPTVVGIEQYQGVIERMYRAGAVTSVKCEVVRRSDSFDWAPTRMKRPVHEYAPLASYAERGDLFGVYAYAELVSGDVSRCVVMNRDEVMMHRARAATTAIWDEWQDAMWRKTACHELEKWVPTSSEYLQQRAKAAGVAARESVPVARPAAPAPVFEGELVDPPQDAEPAEAWPTVATPGGQA